MLKFISLDEKLINIENNLNKKNHGGKLNFNFFVNELFCKWTFSFFFKHLLKYVQKNSN